MAQLECPYHHDHTHRIERLESEMQECQTHIKKSATNVAWISLIGVLFTAASSFASYIVVAILKSKGIL